jgi:transposase-like protein
MGRKTLGPRMVDNLDGSSQARRRLEVILESLAGRRRVEDACRDLEISEARFHELKLQALKGALDQLEPKPAGRPAKRGEPEEVARLKRENEELRIELEIERVRQQIAAVMPHVLIRHEKKTAKGPRSGSQPLFGRSGGTMRG